MPLSRQLKRFTPGLRIGWIVLGFAIIGIGIVYGIKVFGSLKSGGVVAQDASSALAERLMLARFPRSRVSIILLTRSNSLTVDQPAYKRAMLSLAAFVERDPSHPTVSTYYGTGESSFVSRDRHETYMTIGIPGNETGAYLRLRRSLPHIPLTCTFGGPAVADYEINQQVQKDLPTLGAISLPLLIILLILIFRSLVAAALPLLIGAISVLGAFSIVRLISTHMDISIFAANIISLLGLGLAVDYSLLLVNRFRDELAAGADAEAAISISLRTAGESIFLSGTTIMLSLMGLLAFPEMFLRSMGLGGAITVIVDIAASLTILPSILALLGTRINSLPVPFLMQRGAITTEHPFWRSFGRFVVRWPAPILAITLAALCCSGIPFLHVRFANPGVQSLPDQFESRIAAEELLRNFPNSQSAPIQVLVTMAASPVSTAESPALVAYISQLRSIPGITAIHGVTSVGPNVPAAAYPILFSGTDPRIGLLKKRFLSGNTVLFLVDYNGVSSSSTAQRIVRAIHATPVPNASQVLVGGDTAELVDRLQSLKDNLPAALAGTFSATFILLMGMLGSILIPVKAIVLNVLSLSASFGLMTWIFQEGHLERILHFTSSGSLDPTLPLLIYALAFGLATDYEVFLVSRIKEEYLRTGSNMNAILIGVEKTGAIISSAGLLMVIVVAAFGLGRILSMKEMGVGLAAAVAIDTAVVRTLLVPAAMQLFGRMNWWMPGRPKTA